MCIRIMKQKTKIALAPKINERKWPQPRFLLHLIIKSHGRQEMGLPTSSAEVHIQKMMPHMIFRSIQTLCEWQIY